MAARKSKKVANPKPKKPAAAKSKKVATAKSKKRAGTKSKKASASKPAKVDKTAFRHKLREAAALHDLEMQSGLESAGAEAVVSEPPIDRDPAKLDPAFRDRLMRVLEKVAAEGIPFKFHEGFRTVQRQQWLYGQGRPAAKPFGRPGQVVTQKNGTTNLSNHQGNGTSGSGRAADCYPLVNGKVSLNAPESVWKRFAEVAESEGLTAGYRWTKPHDPPHVELR